MVMELGRREWKLGFTPGVGQRPRRRTLSTKAWRGLPDEIAAAKRRFGLPAATPVTSCYEAGRDGLWIHRYLTSLGSRISSSNRPASK
jgi:transposase